MSTWAWPIALVAISAIFSYAAYRIEAIRAHAAIRIGKWRSDR